MQDPTTKETSRYRKIEIYALVAGLAIGLIVFLVCNNKINSVLSKNNEVRQSIVALQSQITRQDNVNKGIPEEDNSVKDREGEVSLLGDKVALDLPDGWSRVTEERCTGGVRDVFLLCYDSAAIAPKSLIATEGSTKWHANIALFERKSRSSAKEWLEQDYYGEPVNNWITPRIYLEEGAADGSELTYYKVYGTRENPDDMIYYHIALRDQYVVFVSAQLVYDGTTPYDYRSDFIPVLEKLTKTIKLN